VLGARSPEVPSRFSAAAQARGYVVALAFKRLLDVSVGVVVATITLPLMVAIAVAIRVDSPGPVIFRPTRIGRRGKPFAMYKFRTMVNGAHERLNEVAHLNLADGMTKIPDDPRVTRVGKWLRRFSLDELPQVVNILAGHMSLVGPRPHDSHELPEADLEHDPRLFVRPGLTGLWQISARSDPSLASRVHFDMLYVTGWSLLLDAKILAKTVPVVVLGQGGRVDSGRVAAGNGHFNGHGLSANGAGSWHTTSGLDPSGLDVQSPTQNGPAVPAINGGIDISAAAIGEAAS
jgi:lipopolysaccharide/colanic/teichoic acid biosynthesis glycosyltransferase